MGRALAQQLEPQSIAVSTARRAQLTLSGLCEGWPGLVAMHHVSDDALYTFSSDDLLCWLAEREHATAEQFVIGHNPALTDLINYLSDTGHLDNLPTAGYARLKLAIDDWSAIGPACGEVDCLLRPKELGD